MKKFTSSEYGGVAFEAIWVTLVLALFVAPTVYLLSFSDDHLRAFWDQRTAARSMAVSGSCSTSGYNPIPITGSSGTKSTTVISCSTGHDGEQDMPNQDRFWRQMETTTNPHFYDLTRDFRDLGKVTVIQADSLVVMTDTFNIGENRGAAGLAGAALNGDWTHSSRIMVPSADYWTFKEAHWKEGHDQIICEGFTADSRKMFPNVFPSSDNCSGSGGNSNSSPPPAPPPNVFASANTGGQNGSGSGTLPQSTSIQGFDANAQSGRFGQSGSAASGATSASQVQFPDLQTAGVDPSLIARPGEIEALAQSHGSAFRPASSPSSQSLSSSSAPGSSAAREVSSLLQPAQKKQCENVEGQWQEIVDEYGGDTRRLNDVVEDVAYACMAGGAYRDGGNDFDDCLAKQGWTQIAGISAENNVGNFHTEVFRNPTTDECVIAFEGSNAMQGDFAGENFQCLRNASTDQAKQAILATKQAKKTMGDKCSSWSTTGHSLAGRLAQVAGQANGVEAIGFNSASVCPNDRRLIDAFKNGADIGSEEFRREELANESVAARVISGTQKVTADLVDVTDGAAKRIGEVSRRLPPTSRVIGFGLSKMAQGGARLLEFTASAVEPLILVGEDAARLAARGHPTFRDTKFARGETNIGALIENSGNKYDNTRLYRCGGDPVSLAGSRNGRGDTTVEGCNGHPGNRHAMKELAEEITRVANARDRLEQYRKAIATDTWQGKPLDKETLRSLCQAMDGNPCAPQYEPTKLGELTAGGKSKGSSGGERETFLGFSLPSYERTANRPLKKHEEHLDGSYSCTYSSAFNLDIDAGLDVDFSDGLIPEIQVHFDAGFSLFERQRSTHSIDENGKAVKATNSFSVLGGEVKTELEVDVAELDIEAEAEGSLAAATTGHQREFYLGETQIIAGGDLSVFRLNAYGEAETSGAPSAAAGADAIHGQVFYESRTPMVEFNSPGENGQANTAYLVTGGQIELGIGVGVGAVADSDKTKTGVEGKAAAGMGVFTVGTVGYAGVHIEASPEDQPNAQEE